jgi:hypothetical protein
MDPTVDPEFEDFQPWEVSGFDLFGSTLCVAVYRGYGWNPAEGYNCFNWYVKVWGAQRTNWVSGTVTYTSPAWIVMVAHGCLVG